MGSLGRSLMEHGMVREAEEAWSAARRLWAELAGNFPDDVEYRKCWLDGLNDSAWTLMRAPASTTAISRARSSWPSRPSR